MTDVRIVGLGSSGDGVGRLDDGRVVFVPGGLPGDAVRVRLTLEAKKVQYAELMSVLEPSPHRVPSRCQVESCGGCALRALDVAAQGEAKRQRVHETLRRLGNIDVGALLGPIRQYGDGWRYRHRVRLHAGLVDDVWRLGYHGRRSRTLVPLTSCPVLWPELEEAAQELGRAIKALPRQARLEAAEIAFSRRDGRAAARLHAAGSIKLLRGAIAEELLSGVEVIASDGRWRFGNLELRYDHGRADSFDLRYEPGLFTQAHPAANDRLVELVLTAVRPRESPRLLELHAGVGNFSVPLALAGARVTAIERQQGAALLARRNARGAGVEIEVRECSDDEAARELGGFDVVLMDPPRTGARAVAEALAASHVGRVVYVSCDVATLARDAAILLAGGYRIAAAEAVDMFPQTPHVEVVLGFERA